MIGELFAKLAMLLSGAALAVLELAALVLAPLRVGALLRSVSLPRMREHRLRTSLTLLGVAIGVCGLVAVVITGRSISRGVNATIDHLAGKADLQVGAGAAGFDEALLERVRSVPGVYRVTPIVQQAVTVRDTRASSQRLLLVGVDLLGVEDEYFRDYDSKELTAIKRDPLAFLNSQTNLVLSRSFADKFGYKLFDTIRFATGSGVRDFKIWGLMDDGGVSRAFGGAVAVMYYPALQVAFGRGQNIDRIDIAVAKGQDVDAVSRRLQAVLGRSVAVEAASLRGGRVANMLQSVSIVLGMASFIALGAALFLIYNTMSISVVQRKRELGILRALGVTRRELFLLLTLEGLLLGSVAAALGVGLAVLIARPALRFTNGALAEIYLQEAVSNVTLEPGVILAAFLVGVLGTALACAIPARQAGLSPPAAVLRTSGMLPIARPTRHIGRADVAGVLSLITAFAVVQLSGRFTRNAGPLAILTLFVGGALLVPRLVQLSRTLFVRWNGSRLGLEAELASGNVTRDLGRTSSTCAALMVATALTVGFATWTGSFLNSMNTWITELLPGDLFVTSGASASGLNSRNIPMEAAFGRELEALRGVAQVRRLRVVDIEYRGSMLRLVSTEAALFERRSRIRVLEGGNQADVFAKLKHGAVYISDNLSHRFDLHAGDRIALFANGGTREFPIAGVVVDYSSDQGAIVMDRATFVTAFADDRVDTFELCARPGASLEGIRSEINQRYGDAHDLFVLTNKEFRGQALDAVNALFALLRALQLVAVIVALLGIVNAIAANVLDRVREFGVLRAIGMLRTRLRRLVVLEAAWVGAIGSTAGVLVGLGLGYVLIEHVLAVQSGWYLPYVTPVGTIGQVLAVMLSGAALAGVYPARVAAALVVTDALEYE